MQFIIRWAINAVALWVTTLVVHGIALEANSSWSGFGTLLLVALIFGLINALVKPVVMVLGCPLYVLTLGLFALVVNALLFMLAGTIANLFNLPFRVTGFWPAFWGAIVMAIVSWLLSLVLPDRLRTKD